MHQGTIIPGYSPVHFCFVFIPACVILFMLSYHAPDSLFHAFARLDSILVRTLLGASGLAPVLRDEFIVLGKSCVQLTRECSILFISIPFVALMIAAPLTLKDKVFKSFWGITLLILINTMRISIILTAGMHSQWLMEYAHMVFSKMIMIMAVLGISIYQLPSYDTPEGTPFHVRFVGFAIVFMTVLSAAWLAVGSGYSRGLIFIVSSLLRLCGYTIHDPAYYTITPMSVDFTGIILFCSLSLASVFLGARPGAGRFVTCLALLVLLQVPAETIAALYFALHVFHDPWIIALMQALKNLILPLVLWFLLIRTTCGASVPEKGFMRSINL